MEAKLLLIPWMVSVLYAGIPFFWFVIHPFAPSKRKMNRSPYLLLLPIWPAMIVSVGMGHLALARFSFMLEVVGLYPKNREEMA